MNSRAALSAMLFGIGAAWGLSQPLTKVAVSTGYRPMGLIFWELVFMVILLGGWQVVRGRGLGLSREHLPLYLAVAVLGTLFSNYISFRSAVLLPAGVMSIIIAVVPMFSVPVAIAMGNEKPALVRTLGVLAGAAAVMLLIGPQAGLPAGVNALWIATACLAPLSYALEGNCIARLGMGDLEPVQVLFGASLLGVVLSLPMMLATGQQFTIFKPWDLALWGLLGSTVVHAIAYSGYVWIVSKAGPVFASQVSYIVTATGMIWSMLILGESYSPAVWAAFVLMMAGIALVRPIPPETADRSRA